MRQRPGTTGRLWMLVAAVCLVLLQATAARSQQPVLHVPSDKLKQKYANALVFFQDPNDPNDKLRGYGVVISDQGHVLTVGHVVALFDKDTIDKGMIKASIGQPSGKLRDLKVVAGQEAIQAEDPGLVVLQLTDKSDIAVAQLAVKDSIVEGAKLRALTGAWAADTTAVVEVDVAARVHGMYQLQGTGIDTGNSGSPLFDYWGMVVGFVEQGRAAGGTSNAQTTLGAQKFADLFKPAPDSISRFKVFIGVRDEKSTEDPVLDYRDVLMNEFHRLADKLQVRRDFAPKHEDNALFKQLFSSLQGGQNPTQQLAEAENVLNSKEASIRSELEKMERGRLYLLLLELRYKKPSPLSGQGKLQPYPVVVELERTNAGTITLSRWDEIKMSAIPLNTTEEVAKTVAKGTLQEMARKQESFTRDMVFLDCVEDSASNDGPKVTSALYDALVAYWKEKDKTPFHKDENKTAGARQDICDKRPDEREIGQDDSYIYSLARESIEAGLKRRPDGSFVRWWKINLLKGKSLGKKDSPVMPDSLRSRDYMAPWVEEITTTLFEGRQ